jgi:hypothetical protein
MHQPLLPRRALLPRHHQHLLQKPRKLLARVQNLLKPASSPGSKVYSAPANQRLQHLHAQLPMAKSVMAVATLHNVASSAIRVVSALKAKANAAMVVVATHAGVVVVNAQVSVAQSATPSAATNHVQKLAQKVVQRLETKIAALVQTVAISVTKLVQM